MSVNAGNLEAWKRVSVSVGAWSHARASLSLVSFSLRALRARAGAPVNLESVDARRRVSGSTGGMVGNLQEICKNSVGNL